MIFFIIIVYFVFSCKKGYYLSRGVCLFICFRQYFYVSITGNDSNSGSFNDPWYSWEKAGEEALPGDIVYFRGGVWYPTDPEDTGKLYLHPPDGRGASGKKGKWIRYWNYPNEKPVFDGSLIGTNQNRWGGGLSMSYVEYIHLKGLTVRHFHQDPPDFGHPSGKNYSETYGLGCGPCANIIYENLVVHDIDGRAFQHWSNAWGEEDADYTVIYGHQNEPPTSFFKIDNTKFINCDAYNLYDRYSLAPGNAADGFKVGTYYNNGLNSYLWEGCRCWNYSDDGIDPHGAGIRIMRKNWMWPGLYFNGIDENWDPESNGYKTAAVPLLNQHDGNFVIHDRNIVVDGMGIGFDINLLLDYDGALLPSNALVYNNFAYKMGIGYRDSNGGSSPDAPPPPSSTYANNIAFRTTDTDSAGRAYDICMWYMDIYDYTNTWRKLENGWKPNPDFNITEDDFVSLDPLDLIIPRNKDGSLPYTNFGKLKKGSKLIDGGTIIEGYHCPRAGKFYLGEDCVRWCGSAPDLGPFQSQYNCPFFLEWYYIWIGIFSIVMIAILIFSINISLILCFLKKNQANNGRVQKKRNLCNIEVDKGFDSKCDLESDHVKSKMLV